MRPHKRVFFEKGKIMAIEIKDPSFKNGRVERLKKKYSIEILQDGVVTQVIDVYPHYYPFTIIGYLVLQALLLNVALTFSDLSVAFSWGGALVTLQLSHLWLSLKYVKENELGGVLFYGRPVSLVSGLVLVPIGLLNLKTLPKTLNQDQFPGDPQIVWKSPDEAYFKLEKEERDRYVLPIRALTATPKETDTRSILNTQMTVEVTFYVKWTIEQFWIFLVRIGAVEELIRQLRDSGERVLVQQIAALTPLEIQPNLNTINTALCNELEKITQDSGIRINEAAMLSPDLTRDVNVAMRNIAVEKARAQQLIVQAEASAQATILTAEAEKKRLSLEGDGNAHATQAELGALAEGAKALNVDAGIVIDLKKAQGFATGTATIFFDQNANTGGNLLGVAARLAAGAKTALDDEPKKQE